MIAAVVVTVVGVELPVAADEGRPVDAAAEVAVRAGSDGETLVVGWELWRGTAGAYEAVDEWVVSAVGADEVVVPGSAVRAELEGLDVADPHVVTVRGRNAAGDGPAATGTFDPEAEPPGVVGELDVRPTAISGQLLVSWTPPVADPPVDEVRVTWPGGSQDVLATDPQGVTIGGMTDGQPVIVTARARSVDGWGPVTLADPMASATPLLAPPEVTAEATGEPGEVEVAWGAPAPGSDGLTPIDGFEVTWSGGGHRTVAGAAARTTILTGLVDGRAYDVRVASRNGAGPGVRATVADVVPSGPPTGAPADLTAEATGTSGEVQLDWADFDPEADGGAAITAFRVEGGGQSFDVTTPEQALVEGLPDGEPVELTVRAVNANGVGPAAVAEATPSGPPTVAPPWLWLQPSPTSGRAAVAWGPVEGAGTGGVPLTGYEISAGEVTEVVDADDTEVTVDGLVDGEATPIRVRGVNPNGAGPWSYTATITTGIPVASPAVRVATTGDTSAHITWDLLPSEQQGSSPVVGYSVWWYETGQNGQTIELGPDVAELARTGLTPGASYHATVSARNEHGLGAGGTVHFVAGRPSAAPSEVEAVPTGTSGEIEVAWTLPAEGLGTATSAVVRNDFGPDVVVPLPATSIVVEGVPDGPPSRYRAFLRSAHGDGPSAESEPVRPATPPRQAPTVEVSARPGALDVTWAGIWDDGGSPVTGYRVEWVSTSGTGSELVDASTFAHTIDDLVDGEVVSVTVAAVNVHGDGVPSEAVVAAPGQLPVTAPGGVTVVHPGQRGALRVSWEPIDPGDWGSGATHEYLVGWGEGSQRVAAGQTSFLIEDLAAWTSYVITVRAVTEVGRGPAGGGEWVWMQDAPTQAPTGVVARPTAIPGRAVVEWSPGGSRFKSEEGSGWVVSWPGGVVDVPGAHARVEISGLPADQPVSFEVRARNLYGVGPPSAPTRPIRADGLAPRPNLLDTPDVGDDTGLGWSALAATLGRSGEVAESGRGSLRFELHTASDEVPVVLADEVPVAAGEEYVASAWLRATRVDGPRAAGVVVLWMGADGSIVGESEQGFVEDLGESWTELTVTATAPEGTHSGALAVIADGGPGDVFHVDGAVLASAGGAAPNLLSEVQSGFETGSLGWTSRFGRIGRTDDVGGHDGGAALRVEVDGRHDAAAGETASVSADPVPLGDPGGDRTVSASAWARSDAGSSEAQVSLTFLGADGAALTTIAGDEVAIDDDGWSEVVASADAPATATEVVLTVAVAGEGGDVRHVDDVAVWAGPPTSRGTNLIPSATAGLETDDLGWLGSEATVAGSVDQARHGLVSLAVTGPGSAGASTDLGTAGIPVEADHQYTASAWVLAWGDSRDVEAAITWYDATGDPIEEATGDPVGVVDGDWRQVSVTAVAPTGAAFASMAVALADTTPGQVFSLDDAAFCLGTSPDCLADVAPAVRPTAPTMQDREDGDVDLSWSVATADRTAEGITGYRIWWDGGELEVTDPAATTATIELDDDVAEVFVAALNAHGEGPAGRAVRSGRPTEAPADLVAAGTGTSGQVEVDWAPFDPAGDGGSPITGFRVRVGDDVVDVTSSEALLESLPDGVPVEVSVRAVNANGIGPAAVAEATPSGPPHQLPSGSVVATATSTLGQVEVTWSPLPAALTGGSSVTGYEVAIGDVEQTLGADAVSAVFDDLIDGEPVRARVRAINANGPGPWADSDEVRPGTPAGVADDVTVEAVSATSARVHWTPIEEGVTPLTRQVVGYRVEGSGSPLTEVAVAVDGDELLVEGLTPGGLYDIEVWGENAYGPGTAAHVAHRAGVPTARPTGVTATSTGHHGEAEVTWTSPASGRGAATEIVVRPSGGPEVVVPLESTSTVLSGLADGDPTSITVAFRSPYGDGPASSEATVVTGGAPVGTPWVWVQGRGRRLDVSWTTVDEDGGSPLTGYLVEWESAEASGEELVEPDLRQLTIPDLTNDVEVSVTVTAVNEFGEGPASAAVVGTPGGPPSGMVTSLVVLRTEVLDEFLLGWAPLAEDDWGSGVERSYEVWWQGEWHAVPAGQTSFLLEGVAQNSYGYVYVRPVTEVGGGAYGYIEVRRGGLPDWSATGVVARPTGVAGEATVEWRISDRWADSEDDVWVVSWPGGSREVPRAVSAVTLDGLPTDALVTIEVRAKNVEGVGPPAVASEPIRADGTGRRPDLLGTAGLSTNPFGWSSMGNALARSGELAESGRSSLRLEMRDGGAYAAADGGTEGIPVTAGETYTASAWVNTGSDANAEAGIVVYWFDADGDIVDASAFDTERPTPTAWAELSLEAVAPPGAARAVLIVGAERTRDATDVFLDGVVFAAATPGSPNLLTEAQSGFEEGMLGWTTRYSRAARSSAAGGHDGLTALRVELDGRSSGPEDRASVAADAVELGVLGPDRQVSASMWVRAPEGGAEAEPTLTFLDAEGGVLGTAVGPTVEVGDTWAEMALTEAAPAGATAVIVGAAFDGAEGAVRYLDDVVLGTGPAPTTNLLAVAPAGFETDALGWFGQRATVGLAMALVRRGLFAMTLVGAGPDPTATTDLGTAGIPVTGDRQYTASAWVQNGEVARSVEASITWYDADGDEISSVTGEVLAGALETARLVSVTAVAPPG
ncbi:MAG TPA: fibronectin type III domain-containing protein, partial [Iamia sp.]